MTDLVVDAEVERCAAVVRRELGACRQQERGEQVDEAERRVGDGQRDETEPDRAFEAVHRVLEASASQHDQVERVADDAEQTDGRTDGSRDDEDADRWTARTPTLKGSIRPALDAESVISEASLLAW